MNVTVIKTKRNSSNLHKAASSLIAVLVIMVSIQVVIDEGA